MIRRNMRKMGEMGERTRERGEIGERWEIGERRQTDIH